MEVPVINRFNGLDSGMNSLPNPSLLPQILASRSGFDAISQSIDLWKWSAVIITVVATFTGVINRIKLLFVILRQQKRIMEDIVDDSDSDGDFSVDDSVCSVSSWSEFEEDAVAGAGNDELEVSSSSRSWDFSDRDFLVKGSDYYSNGFETKRDFRHQHRCRLSFYDQDGDGGEFSWADFGGGKSVVKLWDNFRFEFDCCQIDDDGIRIYDVMKEQNVDSIFAVESVMAPPSTAAGDFAVNTRVNLWDTRVGSRKPALFAEWKPAAGKVAGVKFPGDRKFYLSYEDAGKITVGDVRNVKSALETWFMVSAA